MRLNCSFIDHVDKPPLGTPVRTDGHGSASGLIACWPFNDGVYSAQNQACRISGIVGGDIDVVGTMKYNGDHMNFGLGGSIGRAVSSVNMPTGKYTIVMQFRKTQVTQSSYRGVMFSSQVVGLTEFMPQLYVASDNTIRYYVTKSGASSNLQVPMDGSSSMASVGRMCTIAIAVDDSIGSIRTYGGSRETVASFTARVIPARPITLGFGINTPYNMAEWDGFGGDIFFAAVYNRTLTRDECLSMTANPWQVFQPQQIMFYGPPLVSRITGGGGGIAGGESAFAKARTYTASGGGVGGADHSHFGYYTSGDTLLTRNEITRDFSMAETTKRFKLTET